MGASPALAVNPGKVVQREVDRTAQQAVNSGISGAKNHLADAAKEHAAPAPNNAKLDLLAGSAPAPTTTASSGGSPAPAATTTTTTAVDPNIEKNKATALDSHKILEARLKAYKALPEDQQKAVHEQLGKEEKKLFTPPPTETEKKLLADIRDKENTPAYRGEQFTKLSKEQQTALTQDLGHGEAKKLVAAYEKQLKEDKSSKHTDEKALVKAANENIESVEGRTPGKIEQGAKDFGKKIGEGVTKSVTDKLKIKIW